MQQPFQPYPSLRNRTFLGLIGAQFLAAFNDQCIHAAAMFYAIYKGALTEAQAIALMPILFFAPWAIFCTISGYLADRFSKQYTLILWKVVEVAITGIALTGFYLGTVENHWIGPWLVLGCVFLMGMHSAFFVPAKYGVMPEILPHNLLSKGNGVLESTSFLAIILGTVAGGVLSSPTVFKGREQYIGLILLVLAILGAAASLFIRWMPPADPNRPFPWNPFKPVIVNFRTMLRSKPLALSVLGIAFFTFMVTFMRATMYMHGETRIPRWDEFHISLIVGTVALGIGLGSPLAGWLSGNKVELGLVPLGAMGMMAATVAASFVLNSTVGLVLSLVGLGFFVGFYFVPLYSLMQHRAPKKSKGDLIATSNFINVVGATVASLLFYALGATVHFAGISPEVEQQDLVTGELRALAWKHGVPVGFRVRPDEGQPVEVGQVRPEVHDPKSTEPPPETQRILINHEEDLISLIESSMFDRTLQSWRPGSPSLQVTVSKSVIARSEGEVEYFRIRQAGTPARAVYNDEGLPRFLFLGASLMTLGVLLLLIRQLPDFFVRTLLWMRSTGRYHVKVHGINYLPTDDEAILATNCRNFEDSMHVLACTDRNVRFILLEEEGKHKETPLLRYLARQTGMIVLPEQSVTPAQLDVAVKAGITSLAQGDVVAITLDGEANVQRLLTGLQSIQSVPIIPVYFGTLEAHPELHKGHLPRIRVVIGEPLPANAPTSEIRRAIVELGEWLHAAAAGPESTSHIALPTRGGSKASVGH